MWSCVRKNESIVHDEWQNFRGNTELCILSKFCGGSNCEEVWCRMRLSQKPLWLFCNRSRRQLRWSRHFCANNEPPYFYIIIALSAREQKISTSSPRSPPFQPCCTDGSTTNNDPNVVRTSSSVSGMNELQGLSPLKLIPPPFHKFLPLNVQIRYSAINGTNMFSEKKITKTVIIFNLISKNYIPLLVL